MTRLTVLCLLLLCAEVAAEDVVTYVAGTGNRLPLTSDGIATHTTLQPIEIGFDLSRNELIVGAAEGVFRITAQGAITKISNSLFTALAVDAVGNIFVGEPAFDQIIKIDAVTNAETLILPDAGIQFDSTFALDPQGNLYFVHDEGDIMKLAPGATAPTIVVPVAEQEGLVVGLVADANGNLYYSDSHVVKRLNLSTGQKVAVAGTTRGFSGDGGQATAAQFQNPKGLALDNAGRLLIADSQNGRVRRVDLTSGIVTTIAGGGTSGDGSLATTALLVRPTYLTCDAVGNVYVLDSTGYRCLRVGPGSVTNTEDTDRDGYIDSLETLAGTSVTDAADTPGGGVLPLGSDLFAGFRLKFSPKGDSLNIKGFFISVFPLNFTRPVLLDLGGVLRKFQLDEKGRLVGKSNDRFVLKQKGSFIKITAIFKKGNFAAALADEDIMPATEGQRSLRMFLLIGNQIRTGILRSTFKRGSGTGETAGFGRRSQ